MSRHFSGKRLRAARIAAGLSPEQLAMGVGRSSFSLRAYELSRGLPSVPVLAQLADLLAIPLDELFDDGDADAA